MYLKYILHLKCWRSRISYSSKFFFIKINLYFQWNKRKCHWNPLWKYCKTYMYQYFLKYPNTCILWYENLTRYRSILFYTWLCVLAIHLLLKYYNGIHRIKLVIFSFWIIYIDVQPYIIDNSMSSWIKYIHIDMDCSHVHILSFVDFTFWLTVLSGTLNQMEKLFDFL